MKQEFYDRYKRSLTKRLPEARSKKAAKNRNKRNPSLFQQWSRNLKIQQKSHPCCFPLPVTNNMPTRKPFTDVQVNSYPFSVVPLPQPTENAMIPTFDKENIHGCDESSYFGDIFMMPLQDAENQLPTHLGSANTIQAFTPITPQYVHQEHISLENPNLMFEHPGLMTAIDYIESPPSYYPFYHNIASNVILDKNGKLYAQSSTVRGCWDYRLPNNNVPCPFKKYNVRTCDMSVPEPLIDPDLGFTISESSLVVDMGHTAFYDVMSETNSTDAQETEIAGKFLYIFQDVENLLRQEKQKRKESQKHSLKLFMDSESVFDGTEQWLDSSDLKNESFVNSQSVFLTRKHSDINSMRNVVTES